MKTKALCVLSSLLLTVGILAGCGGSGSDVASLQAQAGVVSGGAAEDGARDTADGSEDADDIVYPSEVNVKKDKFMLPQITMLKSEYVDLQYQFVKNKFDVTWTSSDPSVVKVGKNGSKIIAKRVGEAIVDGISADGKHAFRCEVTVEKKPKNIIYLTFDDGPSRYSTPKVLDILARNDVKATFFELKPALADYDLTRRVIEEGHTLAIHGYSHKYDEIYRSDEAYHKNLTKLQKLFYKEFGQWCTQTRFPGGSSNTVSRHYSVGIMSRLVKKVHEWGFLYQDWNVSSGDAGGANTSDEVFNMVRSGIQKGRSNVVLMHDFSGNDKTINALQRIID
ncbi:MAG: polysaccharide deacetylase family protein, partial [Eubacterium sp.]|nr:polysaccharide deacetylase family protein [Eubacterium sp.]